jgi:hypothetical protein
MKLDIVHQEEYSRLELLLRFLFGFIYIIIPHMFILAFLGIAVQFIYIISFFAILFTGVYPKGMFDFMVKYLRWRMRVGARLANLSDGYPAFGLDATDDNVTLEIPYPDNVSRLMTLMRFLFGFIFIMIPHGICLGFLAIGAYFIYLISFLAVLFTGKYPQGMHEYMVGFMRWGMRVGIYFMNMSDTYPPFSMKSDEELGA